MVYIPKFGHVNFKKNFFLPEEFIEYKKTIKKICLTRKNIWKILLVEDLHDVTHISLNYNKLRSMTDIATHFQFLQYLDLSNNAISDISGLNESNAQNLRVLNLSKNNISTISGLNHLTELVELDLSFNKIDLVGAWIR